MASCDPTLVAERFVRDSDGRWLDLGTGGRVRLRVMPAVARDRHARWLERSAALAGVWHPHIAAPIDFGALADGRRFEALPDCGVPPAGSAGARRRALRAARGFLHALGLSAGRDDPARVGAVDGGLALMCDNATGWPLTRRSGAGDMPGASGVVGVRLQPRAALEWAIGLLESSDADGPRALALRAPAGSGWRTFQRVVAREARTRGFVPLDARVAAATPGVRDLVAGRHVLLIEDRRGGAADASGRRADGVSDLLFGAGLRDLRGCVVIAAVASDEPRATDLDPVPVASLVRMVVGAGAPRESLGDLARRAGGNPGRFLRLLAGDPSSWRTRGATPPALVRETRPAYAGDPPAAAPAIPIHPRMLARRRRARELVRRGRHAAAVRLMRALVGACDRRGDVATADDLALSLGAVLAGRGRPAEGLPWLDRAARSTRLETRLSGAVALASACTDLGELGRAARLCRTAALVAGREGHGDMEAAARLTLARALLWQGRYRAAAAELTVPAGVSTNRPCERAALHARVCLAQQRLAEAGRQAAAARAAAYAGGADEDVAAAEAVTAAVSATLADAAAVRAHLAEAIAAAARGRLALAGLDARLEAAEGWVRAGRPDQARPLVLPLGRRRRALPPLLVARLNAVLGAAGDQAAADAAGAFAASAGAVLVRLPGEESDMSVIEEATGIMAACQEADATDATLEIACHRLVASLGARGVAIVARDGDADTVLARVGPAWPCLDGGASRALATGAPVGPSLGAAGIESAVAVRYGGRTIGAVTCRWPADARVEAPRAAALLSAAATACAPAVRASLDTRLAVVPAPDGAGAALLGESPAIANVRLLVARAARAPFAALIEGESGTGKELVARLIHETGPRRGHRFCAVNCAALGDDLLEAELFGHARGAFTGALAERAGLFEEADRGTLLLDEVSDLSPRAQAKLLRAIQEGEVRRLGENLPRRVDVRIVAATNRPLEEEVRLGRFRADLRYRLDVIRIEVPPLRDRVEDIPLLAAHFWRHACARTGRRPVLGADVLAALARHDWPGNVRELQNVLASLAVHSGARGRARPGGLPEHIARAAPVVGSTLDEARTSFERRFVRAALARAGGHRGRAARALGISRQGLAKLMKRLDLEAAG